MPINVTLLSFHDRKENTQNVVTEKMKIFKNILDNNQRTWFMRIFKVDVTLRCDFPRLIIPINDVLM